MVNPVLLFFLSFLQAVCAISKSHVIADFQGCLLVAACSVDKSTLAFFFFFTELNLLASFPFSYYVLPKRGMEQDILTLPGIYQFFARVQCKLGVVLR